MSTCKQSSTVLIAESGHSVPQEPGLVGKGPHRDVEVQNPPELVGATPKGWPTMHEADLVRCEDVIHFFQRVTFDEHLPNF